MPLGVSYRAWRDELFSKSPRRVFEITADPMVELSYLNSADVMKTVEKPLAAGGVWEFPAASVSALEIGIAG